MPNRGAAEPAPREVVAPGDDRARVTVRNRSGRAMPVNFMKSRIAFS
jgi:hypothetical protein